MRFMKINFTVMLIYDIIKYKLIKESKINEWGRF